MAFEVSTLHIAAELFTVMHVCVLVREVLLNQVLLKYYSIVRKSLVVHLAKCLCNDFGPDLSLDIIYNYIAITNNLN